MNWVKAHSLLVHKIKDRVGPRTYTVMSFKFGPRKGFAVRLFPSGLMSLVASAVAESFYKFNVYTDAKWEMAFLVACSVGVTVIERWRKDLWWFKVEDRSDERVPRKSRNI